MKRDKWFPRGLSAITVALLVAACFGGVVAVALAASEPDVSPSAVAPVDRLAVDIAASPASPSMWVDPDLLRRLDSQHYDALLSVIVVLDTPSADPVDRLLSLPTTARAKARARFVAEKQAQLDHARGALSPLLDEAERRGRLVAQRELWLVDALALTARPALLRDLMASPSVAEIHFDHYRQYLGHPDGVGTDLALDRAYTPEPAGDGDTAHWHRTASWRDADLGTLLDGPDSAGSGQPGRASSIGASLHMPGQAVESQTLDDVQQPWGLGAIRAPELWRTLGISGTGAVVAVVDTGADWQHPDLIGGYRGALGSGLFLHDASWFDAVSEGIYPYDDHGHGTHVIGTAVGDQTGVAPGAQWIAVKVLSGEGYGYDSWILDGFQWLLAPGGDPHLAPDVVNCSWSSSQSSATPFLAAIEALEAAGIFPVFATGNAGPEPGSVGSPASNPGVFAVGASDPDRDVAFFSGRGPSPWEEMKPLVSAPGVNVVSAAPGGTYQTKSGTSMATPHVAGLGALMRGISPTLPVADMARIITSTAQPLTVPVPNDDSGWGQIDAFDALVMLANPAMVTGTVSDDQGLGLAGAIVTAWSDTVTPGEAPGSSVTTDGDGRYTLALQTGRYVVRSEAFGYWPATAAPVGAVAGELTRVDFAMTSLPRGQVVGRVSVLGSTIPLTTEVMVRALDTPVETTVAEGLYDLTLPSGTYTLEARGLGYRVLTGTVEIVPGEVQTRDFSLESAPTLLLIDEGAWYYGSKIEYWMETLDALRYAYDQLRIKVPASDAPVSTTLTAYDVVLWSSPLGSPGLVGSGTAITDYLGSGGRFLLSGQDVAFLDGGGLAFWGQVEPYLLDHMSVDFAAERGEQLTAVGEGPYEGMTVTLAGGSGANNQTSPDVVGLRDPETASELWRFGDASLAGVAAETCVPHRSLFFSFGLEGVADASDRSDVLQRGIDWLITEPPTAGLRISHLTNPTQVANPGEMVTHVISLRHIGARGVTETITVSVEGGDWPTLVNPAAFELSPCSEMPVTVTVAIPLDVGINAVDIVTLAARSDLNTAPVTLSLVSKAPAPVLLVDDDRWYPMEQRYIDALAVAGIPFDLWDTLSSSSGSAGLFSPDTHTLLRYPIVIWFTGYDWYAPLVDVEIERLLDYVDQGGRLLLSSQDYAYHHEESPLTGRLGILLADWTDEATEAGAVVEHPAGGLWGPLVLDYPFPNWSQTIEPAPEAAPVIRGQLGQPVGIGVGTAEHGGGETLFYAFPLEALPLETHSQALANGVGWLSPLGGSHWDLTPTVCAPGDAVSFHLTLRNSDTVTLTVAFTHAVPEDFAISPGQLPPELDYSVMSQEISWSGPVAPMGEVPLTWHAVWRGTTALPSMPSVTLSLPAWELSTSRTAPFYGVGPDLTASDWLTDGLGGARSGEAISVTYAIRNTSGVAADDVELSLWMMRGVGPITATTPLTGGLAMPVWQGSVASQETQTATLLIQGRPWDVPLRVDALLEDGAGLRWEDSLWLALDPWQSFLPVVTRSD